MELREGVFWTQDEGGSCYLRHGRMCTISFVACCFFWLVFIFRESGKKGG